MTFAAHPYLSDRLFLKDLDLMNIKEIFVKIIVLDLQENIVEEIQGKVSGGGPLNIDGGSSLRRTLNLTFVPSEFEDNLMSAKNIISINKKVRVELGYTNNLMYQYPNYKGYPVIWFPLGTYVLTDVSLDQGLDGTSISISLQDKMCLLNGTCGGTLPATTTLHSYLSTDEDGNEIENPILIYNIIQEIVSHYGGEELGKILIRDVPLKAKETIRLSPEAGSLYRSGLNLTTDSQSEDIVPISYPLVASPGGYVGYRMTDFTFPGELILDAGQTACDALDKIIEVLGNYEYFYDVYGNFVFQEIKNYLNTPHVNVEINALQSSDYSQYSRFSERLAYDFEDNELINSFSNSPNYSNIKNDFTVWGKHPETSLPIRYHLVIDKKPVPRLTVGDDDTLEDWRNVFYRLGEGVKDGRAINAYYSELMFEWPTLYNLDTYTWRQEYLDDPSKLTYYLDFIDTDSALEELGVSNIGRKSLVIVDEAVNCIFPPVIPDVYIFSSQAEANAQAQGRNYLIVGEDIQESLIPGTAYKDAFSVVRECLYKNTNYNNTVAIQTIPIYYLDANTRISIYDSNTDTAGEYIITSLSVPITINETMSISATKALERV